MRNMNNITPPNDMTHIGKEDLYSKSASLVPIFAARCHSFRKYFFTQETNNKMIQTATMIYINNPFTSLKEDPNDKDISVNSD